MSAPSVPAASAASAGGHGGGRGGMSSSHVHTAVDALRGMTTGPSHTVASAEAVTRPVFENFGLLQASKKSARTQLQAQVDKITRVLHDLVLGALPAAAAFAATELPSTTLSQVERLVGAQRGVGVSVCVCVCV